MLIFLSISHLPLRERRRQGKNDSAASVPGIKVVFEGQTADMLLKADAFSPLSAPCGKIIGRKKLKLLSIVSLLLPVAKNTQEDVLPKDYG